MALVAVRVTRCGRAGTKNFNRFSGLPTPSGLIGAGKIESRKLSVEVTPGLEDVTTKSDTSEHTEKYMALKSTGLFLGHAGPDEGG